MKFKFIESHFISHQHAELHLTRSSAEIARARGRYAVQGYSTVWNSRWNSLPPDVTSAPTLTVFRNRLKTHLFSRSFPFQLFSASSSVHRV